MVERGRACAKRIFKNPSFLDGDAGAICRMDTGAHFNFCGSLKFRGFIFSAEGF